MDDIWKGVFDAVNYFMKNPKYVNIHYENVEILSNIILQNIENNNSFKVLEPTIDEITFELVANSINYCYWYASPYFRPGNSSAMKMYELLDKTFYENLKLGGDLEFLDHFIDQLIIYRFPLLEDRIKHLKEVNELWFDFSSIFLRHLQNGYEPPLQELIRFFPGYASDIFLKRASLFFLTMNRKFGCFHNYLNNVFVPADYQLPRVLKNYGCISYSYGLENKIRNFELIEKGSLMEAEIRSATILVCKKIQENTKMSIANIDMWLWSRRKECSNPFHLTITTDY